MNMRCSPSLYGSHASKVSQSGIKTQYLNLGIFGKRDYPAEQRKNAEVRQGHFPTLGVVLNCGCTKRGDRKNA